MQNVSTCLWFDDRALEAVEFYVSIFPNSRIVDKTVYPEGGLRPAGSVLTVRFALDGVEYLALNGGPHFRFSPAISMVAYCDSQAQTDILWEHLLEGGQPSQCGWLTDRYGLSWQIVPRRMMELLAAPDTAASRRAFAAMMKMIKIDIATAQAAFDGED